MVAANWLKPDELDKIAQAATIIDQQGLGGFEEAAKLCGRLAAGALLMAKCHDALQQRDSVRPRERWHLARNMLRGVSAN